MHAHDDGDAHHHAATGAYTHWHSHAHGPGHGHAHDHHHGTGILGWLRDTFAHSHDVDEKIDETMETNERGIWALKISLRRPRRSPRSCRSSSSSISARWRCWRTRSTTSPTPPPRIPLWIAFALARRGASRALHLRLRPTEDVAGVLHRAVIFFSACVAG